MAGDAGELYEAALDAAQASGLPCSLQSLVCADQCIM